MWWVVKDLVGCDYFVIVHLFALWMDLLCTEIDGHEALHVDYVLYDNFLVVLVFVEADLCWGLWGYRCLGSRIAYTPAPLKISCSAFSDKRIKFSEALCILFYYLVAQIVCIMAMAKCL